MTTVERLPDRPLTSSGEDAMDHESVNTGRRRFLVRATSVVGAAGVVGASVPFVGSWFPSAKARAAGAPVKINVNKIEPGQQMIAQWRGQPVFILRRTPEILSRLGRLIGELADPESHESAQPGYVDPALRSIRPEIVLLVGICTHLGCSPTFRPDVAPMDLGEDWVGGYFCPCHGSRYDLAGRVYKSQPAPLNLPVPPHSYESDSVIVIGIDQENA
jgi:ubiquinol-cytochrome c reductase iron-sulfur subunit